MHPKWRTILLLGFALLMFAANSLLCRMALGAGSIDAASYSSIRLISGALMLMIIGWFRGTGNMGGDWYSSLLLFLYAIPFSFAYLGLTTGTGALILFACVQITMILAGWRAGERPHLWQWIGLLLALSGLVYLLSPGLHAPDTLPAGLMAIAGIAWGLYSIRGRTGGDAFLRTRGNFIRAVPMAVIVSVIAWPHRLLNTQGIVLAISSGALASALGYVAWYAALKHLTAIRASVLQLLVPILAAFSGVVMISEPVDLRLILSGGLVIGGIWLTLERSNT